MDLDHFPLGLLEQQGQHQLLEPNGIPLLHWPWQYFRAKRAASTIQRTARGSGIQVQQEQVLREARRSQDLAQLIGGHQKSSDRNEEDPCGPVTT